ncbi:MAG: hypothetical protein ACFE9S_15670 [Candidatus Hermodarchaeota archaeon]
MKKKTKNKFNNIFWYIIFTIPMIILTALIVGIVSYVMEEDIIFLGVPFSLQTFVISVILVLILPILLYLILKKRI